MIQRIFVLIFKLFPFILLIFSKEVVSFAVTEEVKLFTEEITD